MYIYLKRSVLVRTGCSVYIHFIFGFCSYLIFGKSWLLAPSNKVLVLQAILSSHNQQLDKQTEWSLNLLSRNLLRHSLTRLGGPSRLLCAVTHPICCSNAVQTVQLTICIQMGLSGIALCIVVHINQTIGFVYLVVNIVTICNPSRIRFWGF